MRSLSIFVPMSPSSAGSSRPCGSATATCEMSGRGDLSIQMRNSFSVEGQRQEALQRMFTSTVGKMKITDVKFDDLKDLSKPEAKFTVTLEIEVGNFRDQPIQEALRIVLDARTSFEKEVSVAPWSTAKVTLPVPPGGPGLHLCEISLAPDDLTLDDH